MTSPKGDQSEGRAALVARTVSLVGSGRSRWCRRSPARGRRCRRRGPGDVRAGVARAVLDEAAVTAAALAWSLDGSELLILAKEISPSAAAVGMKSTLERRGVPAGAGCCRGRHGGADGCRGGQQGRAETEGDRAPGRGGGAGVCSWGSLPMAARGRSASARLPRGMPTFGPLREHAGRSRRRARTGDVTGCGTPCCGARLSRGAARSTRRRPARSGDRSRGPRGSVVARAGPRRARRRTPP